MRKLVFMLMMIVGNLSCNQKKNEIINNQDYYMLDFNRNKSILVELGVFTDEATAIDITNDDLLKFEIILARYVEGSFNKNSADKIDLQGYGRQYVAASTASGENIVYVNCFCQPEKFKDRATKLIVTSDGGQCFFSLKINVGTAEVFEFSANGLG